MTQAAQQTVDIKFTVMGLNYVLDVLAKQPYGDVAPLLDDIRRQAIPQLQQPTDSSQTSGEVGA